MSGGNPNMYDMYNNYWRAAMDHGEDSAGDELAFKADFERSFEDAGILTALRFGARYSEREQDIRSTTWNWGALAETWGGRGPVWLDEHVDGVPNTNGLASYTAGIVTGGNTYVDNFDNFMRGRSPTPTPVRLYNGSLTGNGYTTASNMALTIGEEWRPLGADQSGHWVPLAISNRHNQRLHVPAAGNQHHVGEGQFRLHDVEVRQRRGERRHHLLG